MRHDVLFLVQYGDIYRNDLQHRKLNCILNQ
jgi:hypothetical protein